MTEKNILNDQVFGRMEYKHSWFNEQKIDWWGEKKFTVKITAHAYKGDEISEAQRNAFSEYMNDIGDVIEKSKPMLVQFANDAYETSYVEQEIVEALTPRTVLFQQDGTWGILFDAEFDIENGIALYKDSSGDFKVGTQDDFL